MILTNKIAILLEIKVPDIVILASKNEKIIISILDYIAKLPRISEDIKAKKNADFYVELLLSKNGDYYLLKSNCDEKLLEYTRGFCCGYMTGIKFDNK